MIIEHEIIEQIESEPNGRSLAWVCDLARQHGKEKPLIMLEQMCRAGYVTLRDEVGQSIAAWKCDGIWRLGDEAVEGVNVVATDAGSRWVHA